MSFPNAGESAIPRVINVANGISQEWQAAHKAANKIFSSVASGPIHIVIMQV
jgi:hypothetical protein